MQQLNENKALLLTVYLIRICLLFKPLGLHYSLFLTERYFDPPIVSLANNLIGFNIDGHYAQHISKGWITETSWCHIV